MGDGDDGQQMSSCPLCGEAATHKVTMPIDSMTFQPTSHGSIYECSACQFGFVYPRPKDTAAFYDLNYYTHGASHMAKPRAGFLSKLRNHLAWRADQGEALPEIIEAQLPRGAKVVDIGCGDGWLLDHMTERGYLMTGVERDVKALKGQALQGSADALPDLPRGSFDGAAFSHVIEHLVDPIGALRNAAALLKPGGLLFVEVPNNESRAAQVAGLSWMHLDIPRHLNFFTADSLRELGQRAGLEVKRTYFSNYCRLFADSYILTEQQIHDKLPSPDGSTRNTQARAWRLLAETAAAPARRKYDSVGAVFSR